MFEGAKAETVTEKGPDSGTQRRAPPPSHRTPLGSPQVSQYQGAWRE